MGQQRKGHGGGLGRVAAKGHRETFSGDENVHNMVTVVVMLTRVCTFINSVN